jgi:plasmid stability protein
MDQLVIELEDDVIEELRQRARRHGRSVDEEVREILRNAVASEGGTPVGLGTQLAAIFHGVGIDEEIAELRGHPVVPIEFDP